MSGVKTNAPETEPLKVSETKHVKVKNENKTFLEKLSYIKSNITVEPILAGLIIPSMLSRLAIQNLNLEKACRIKLGLDDALCNALIKKEDTNSSFNFTGTNYEEEVQKVIASIEAWKSIIQTALPTLFVIFMGAWSDRTGNRKFCILLPIIGEFLVCITNIISTIFFDEIPVEVTMFFEGFLPAITGGWVLMYLGVFSYISDVTGPETRTFRVGLVNLCMTAGIPIGTAASGIFLKWYGYYGIFGISGAIHIMNITYGVVYLKSNTKPNHDKENVEKSPLTFRELVSLVKETAAFAFKKREGNMRKKVLITLFTVAILYGPNHAERIVFYMYLRYKLDWNAVKFSMYATYSVITHSLGALFSISIFSKRWGWHDSVLCLISIISKFVGSIYLAFIQNNLMMFMLPILEILNATTWTSMRSMASKLVSSEEMGKMNSLFSLVETLAAMLFDPMYSGIYRTSVSVFPGSVFIFSAIMILPAMCLLLWVFTQHRREHKEKKRQKKEDVEDMQTDIQCDIVKPKSELEKADNVKPETKVKEADNVKPDTKVKVADNVKPDTKVKVADNVKPDTKVNEADNVKPDSEVKKTDNVHSAVDDTEKLKVDIFNVE